MSLLTDFKTRFPGFDSTVADTYVPAVEPVWSEYYTADYTTHKEAVLNLVAHLVVLESDPGHAGLRQVLSHGAGGVSESFVSPASTSGQFWAATKYGQRFLQLTRSNYGGVAV